MSSSNHEEHLPAAAMVGQMARLSSGRPEIQAFLANLESHRELDPLATHVFGLLLAAFTARDRQFPKSGCSTIRGAGPIPQMDVSDEFVSTAVDLVREGANGHAHDEQFGALGLVELINHWPNYAENLAHTARAMLWLECNSELAILSYAADWLAPDKLRGLAQALCRTLAGSDSDTGEPPLSRGEQYVTVAWLSSLDTSIQEEWEKLAVRPAIVPPIRVFGTARASPRLNESIDETANLPLTGRLASIPAGPVGTAISAFTGWLFIRRVASWMARTLLAYRADAEIRVTEKGLEVKERKSLLGRQFREKNSLIALGNVRRLTREIRYARSGTYAGLAALGLGSFLGMRLFVNGLRVPGLSGPLLLLGLAVVIGGLSLDFLLVNWLDAARGKCRVVVVAERGPGLCLSGVESTQADAVLSALAKKLTSG